MEVTEYAPVIIPTLCRYDHFKDCIESLMECTGSEYTDVYVGLDYPLKKSHEEGWRKIDEYLLNLEQNNPFNRLVVIRRERNYGFGDNGNFRSLVRFVFEKYDRLIATEDDNIFSKAFLDFINKGLEKFKDDHSVLSINGYRHFYDVKFGDNNYYMQNVDFSAWGYGIWKDRYEVFMNNNTNKYWRKKAMSLKNWWKVYTCGLNRLIWFVHEQVKPPTSTDYTFSIYMPVNNMNVVMPKVSMVRNRGWDGTGEHCPGTDAEMSSLHVNQELYHKPEFTYIGTGKEYYNLNHRTYVKQSYGRVGILDLLRMGLKKIGVI